MATDTQVTDSFRESTTTNLQGLAERRNMLEADVRRIEDESREALREYEANHRAALATALAPVEAALRDCNSAIYATERMLGALPAVAPRFQSERDSADRGEGAEEEAPAAPGVEVGVSGS